MADANLTIAVDGGANVFHNLKLQPDLIIGDLDSVKEELEESVKFLKREDPNFTDLQKALAYVFEHYQPEELILLGATGGRTDHMINNLQILTAVDPRIIITVKNDALDGENPRSEIIMRITPLSNTTSGAKKGSTLSIIAVSEFAGLHSKGLFWEIDDAKSGDELISQSNRVTMDDPRFSIDSGCVYIAVYQ